MSDDFLKAVGRERLCFSGLDVVSKDIFFRELCNRIIKLENKVNEVDD